ncbi:MAG: DNA polymerase III subunit beta [Slackia sp.]
MRFNINKSELLNALTIVSKAASSRSTLPVLSGVYVKAQGSSLVMQTTDLERSIRYTVPALIEEEGSIVIPEKLLLDIVKQLPEAAVGFETQEGTVSVSCDKSSFVLKTLDPNDFPEFPVVDVNNRISVPFDTFCHIIKRVARSFRRSRAVAVLTGVLISTNEVR